MTRAQKAKVIPISKQFIPASHSLASGLMKEAVGDVRRFLRKCRDTLLDLWLDTAYSTALYVQQLKGGFHH